MSLIDAWGWEQMCLESRPKPKRKEGESMDKVENIVLNVALLILKEIIKEEDLLLRQFVMLLKDN